MAAAHGAPDQGEQLDTTSPVAALRHLWNTARQHVYPDSLVATHFNPVRYAELEAQASSVKQLGNLAAVFNPFLERLGVSHTRLFVPADVEYALFRSLFSTRVLNEPQHAHLGMQYAKRAQQWYVRETWNGLPADLAGLRRGDALLAVDGDPFDLELVCDGGASAGGALQRLTVRRADRVLNFAVPCLRQNPNASLLGALRNSVRILQTPADAGGRRIGYLHLWAGTHPDILSAYLEGVEALRDTDALILDLRGGFGGAWYEYLDPFFADRKDFYAYTVLTRDSSEEFFPEPHHTADPYAKPMIVLINEGVRSGKEALAYQFKKSGRATLVGTNTRGAFSAGRGFFVAEGNPLLLYLSVAEYRLDGQRIEGVGIAPDVVVHYPIAATGKDSGDPQLAAALDLLSEPRS